MAIIGNLISRSLRIRKQFTFKLGTPRQYQLQVLRRLVEKAKHTQFGEYYGYEQILNSPNWVSQFRQKVPVHNYNKMHSEWWYKCQEGVANVSWPEKIKYFALSSGTSESASKHIPVTKDMLRTVKKVGV